MPSLCRQAGEQLGPMDGFQIFSTNSGIWSEHFNRVSFKPNIADLQQGGFDALVNHVQALSGEAAIATLSLVLTYGLICVGKCIQFTISPLEKISKHLTEITIEKLRAVREAALR